MKKLFVLGLAVSALFFTSCNNDDDVEPSIIQEGDFAHGLFVLNEGGFGAGNSTVSFLNEDGTVSQQIFKTVNGENLGDVAQSLYLDDSKAYIVLNGSAKVEVVDRYTFESLGTITAGLVNPRYFIISNGKGFVSNWGDPTNPDDDFIAVINLSNYTVESTISVPEGPERMVVANNKLYIAQMGGWGYGNSVSVINPSTQNVIDSIPVNDVPESMVVDGNMLFVLSSGKPAWTGNETQGSFAIFETGSDLLVAINVFGNGFHPINLRMDNGNLYLTESDKVYSVDSGAISIHEMFSTSAQGVFGAYGFTVRDGKFYIGDAGDYTSDGTVYIYDNNGSLLNSFTAGLLPRDFGFND